jgi:predicted HTH transcriptional regulator
MDKEKVLDYIKKHVNRTVSFTRSPERVDEGEYPPDGLREIVVNAIVHRDYQARPLKSISPN